jgi:hypothetical protein
MQNRLFFAALIIPGIGVLTSQADAEVSLDSVLKSCEQKTPVFGRDEKGAAVKVGENIDPFCRGFLPGALAILLHTRTICVENKDTSPDFLLSTVQTYRAQHKNGNDVAVIIEAAFKRAFNCRDVVTKPNDPLGIR